jgi:8-oxo-dGTP pyrophosphatase MutT (NUDIX family)
MNVRLFFQVIAPDPKLAMNAFFNAFKRRKTAGGLVRIKEQSTFLVIKRFSKLDLPKGHIEKGESAREAALREVYEETGLTGKLELISKCGVTYHVFEKKGKSYLKKNTWYVMNYTGDLSTTPQTEEGIDAVFWYEKDQLIGKLNAFYPGLSELIVGAC